MNANRTLLILAVAPLLTLFGCKGTSDTTTSISSPSAEPSQAGSGDAEKIGLKIADLLSKNCKDGWHFGSMGDSDRASPRRAVRMESQGEIDGKQKFLGYQWKGMFDIGPAGEDGKFTGGSEFGVFERGGHWYLEPDEHSAPVPVDELESVAPACPQS